MKKEVVCVGLSGGVDSSVAAYLLKKQGYTVLGVFIKVWQPDFLQCHWEQERLDAMRVAAQLEIPFFTCDAEEAYRKEVGEYFIESYKQGYTPNPDVMCNTHVKFGRFYAYAQSLGATKIATGHYAQIAEKDGRHAILRGIDDTKDQSYFLSRVPQKVLPHVLFPIGDMRKTAVRKLAEKIGLPTAEKKDSQGICFLGHVDIREFLSHYIDMADGAVLNEHGEKIGTHHGAVLYTLGQRHGFVIDAQKNNTTPHFVVAKDIKNNTISVAAHAPEKTVRTILLRDVMVYTTIDGTLEIETRYHGARILGTYAPHTENEGVVTLAEEIERPASGQVCVFYKKGILVGSGIIEDR